MKVINLICTALKRTKIYCLSIFIIYIISVIAGIMMSHNGNNFALNYRDKIVGQSLKTNAASENYQKGNGFTAALYDFKGNLLLGAVPQSVLGFTVIIPFFSVMKQGWVGGIVSIDGEHKSRFKNIKSTLYYLIVILGQLIPYSLAIGAGVKCGIDFYNDNRTTGWNIRKFKIPITSLTDLGYIYIIVIPLFFLTSCFEFLSNWNM